MPKRVIQDYNFQQVLVPLAVPGEDVLSVSIVLFAGDILESVVISLVPEATQLVYDSHPRIRVISDNNRFRVGPGIELPAVAQLDIIEETFLPPTSVAAVVSDFDVVTGQTSAIQFTLAYNHRLPCFIRVDESTRDIGIQLRCDIAHLGFVALNVRRPQVSSD